MCIFLAVSFVEQGRCEFRFLCGGSIVEEGLQVCSVRISTQGLCHLVFFQKDVHLFEQTVQEIVHHTDPSSATRSAPLAFVTFAFTTRIVFARST